MLVRLAIPVLCALALLASGCSGVSPSSGPEAPAPAALSGETAVPSSPAVQQGGPLFLDAGRQDSPPSRPAVSRSRFAKINQGLLLDEQGTGRSLSSGAAITLNLFPDTTYTAVIDEVLREEGTCTWTGHLQGVDASSVTIVYTAGVFIVHAASPAGVYEASSVGEDIYQIIQIDQQKLPGGEGDVIMLT